MSGGETPPEIVSPLTRKPKRSYLIVWVGIGFVAAVAAVFLLDPFLPDTREASRTLKFIGAAVGLLVLIVRLIVLVAETDPKERRRAGRALYRDIMPD